MDSGRAHKTSKDLTFEILQYCGESSEKPSTSISCAENNEGANATKMAHTIALEILHTYGDPFQNWEDDMILRTNPHFSESLNYFDLHKTESATGKIAFKMPKSSTQRQPEKPQQILQGKTCHEEKQDDKFDEHQSEIQNGKGNVDECHFETSNGKRKVDEHWLQIQSRKRKVDEFQSPNGNGKRKVNDQFQIGSEKQKENKHQLQIRSGKMKMDDGQSQVGGGKRKANGHQLQIGNREKKEDEHQLPIQSSKMKVDKHHSDIQSGKKKVGEDQFKVLSEKSEVAKHQCKSQSGARKADEIFKDKIKLSSREDISCVICHQDTIVINEGLLACGHKFCFSCIHTWAKAWRSSNHPPCPLCKQGFDFITHRDLGNMMLGVMEEIVLIESKTPENKARGIICTICTGDDAPELFLMCAYCQKRGCHYFCLDPPQPLGSLWSCKRCNYRSR